MTTRSRRLNQDAINDFRQIRLIATDMDGTLTQHGKFTPALLHILTELFQADLPVLIVTGRSAGWVQSVVHYLPVVGAIAENGGVMWWGNGRNEEPQWLSSIAEVQIHRQKLRQMFQTLQQEFPQIQESSDNLFRLTDWTFDVQGLSSETLKQMHDRCQAQGFGFTYSTVQCHIKPLEQDKAIGLEKVLQQDFPELDLTQVVTVGDSPNDESLFDSRSFPLSVGVANIQDYLDRLTHQPTYITQASEIDGFCELANWVLMATAGKI